MVKIRDWGPLSKLKGFQSCLPLCNPVDYTAHGILQARILEWVAFPFSRGSSQPRDRTQVSCIAGRFFTSWATGKPGDHLGSMKKPNVLLSNESLLEKRSLTPWAQGTQLGYSQWLQQLIWRDRLKGPKTGQRDMMKGQRQTVRVWEKPVWSSSENG